MFSGMSLADSAKYKSQVPECHLRLLNTRRLNGSLLTRESITPSCLIAMHWSARPMPISRASSPQPKNRASPGQRYRRSCSAGWLKTARRRSPGHPQARMECARQLWGGMPGGAPVDRSVFASLNYFRQHLKIALDLCATHRL